MNVEIMDGCIKCSLCAGVCPEVFRMTGSGYAEVYQGPTEAEEDAVREAVESCPVSVIQVDE